jgi:prepilin-type N-terminal cleavage/methylation domain-containing protein
MKTEKLVRRSKSRGGYKAFTLPEILTVIVIIAIMLGILMPALSQVKKLAKDTKQKAQIVSIEIAITLYKNDFGEYPPSYADSNGCSCASYYDGSYSGSQALVEAMFGQDLLGFNPYSVFKANGKSRDDVNDFYPKSPQAAVDGSLRNRKDPYLDRTNISVFTPQDIFDTDTCSYFLEKDRYVICDVFTAANREINGKTYKVGTPVLYFRANPSALNTELTPYDTGAEHAGNIYNYRDNYFLMTLGKITDEKIKHPLCPGAPPTSEAKNGRLFYGYMGDPMIPKIDTTTCGRPVRPDSFLLISAGSDGLYGTKDDICNFNPNLP